MDVSVQLSWLFLGMALVSLLVLLALQSAALIMVARRRLPRSADALPPISILKPLKGIDSELRTNLEAFLVQDYPSYELIFGVKDPDDPVIPSVRQLMRDYPEAPLRLYVGSNGNGMNPKVANLSHIARYARYEHWLISDADVRPGRDYLRALAGQLGERVGLVHNVLVGTGERRLGSIFENLHMNSFVAAAQCGAHLVRHSCVVGKSMLFHRRHLDAVGGFGAVENLLAEDYALGRLFQRSGCRVQLSTYALPAVNPGRGLSSFVNRQLRWAQMRRRVCLRAYLAEALGNPIAWALLSMACAGAAPAGVGSGSLCWSVAGAIVAVKCAADVALSRMLRGDFRALVHLPWIPVKDVAMAVIWMFGLFRRRINWRGNRMWIGPESRLYASPHEPAPVAHTARA